MTRYRVTFGHDVDASTPGEAEAIARSRPAAQFSRVVNLDPPAGNHNVAYHYVMPVQVLDLAWDEYMDRTVTYELGEDCRFPRPPSLSQLSQGGVSPAGLSLLFDLAITAYVQGTPVRPKRGPFIG